MKVSHITNTGISKYVKSHTKENLNKEYSTNIDIKNKESDMAFGVYSNQGIVSFGGKKTFVLEEGQSIDSVKTKLYIGRKNSSAYEVESDRVILEDGAPIRHLNLVNKYFVPPFPLSYEEKIYDLNKTKVIMIGNAQINSLTTEDGSLPNVDRIYNGAIPKILDGLTYIDSVYFLNNVVVKDKIPRNVHNRIILRDNAFVDKLNCNCINVMGKSHLNTAHLELSGSIGVYEEGTVDLIENASYIEMERKAKVKNITSSEKIKMSGDSFVENCDVDEAYLSSLSKVKNLTCNKIEIDDGLPQIENLKTKTAELGDFAKVKNLEADEVVLRKNASVEKMVVKNRLEINNDGKVSDVTLTGDNARVVISGNRTIGSKINFEGKNGEIHLIADKNGYTPKILLEGLSNCKVYVDGILQYDIERKDPKDLKETYVSPSLGLPVNSNIEEQHNDSTSLKGFAKVAGMDELKRTLYEDVIYPMTRPELYKEYGLEPVNGFLLYGPPGCGKTYIAKALAEETGRYFVEMPASSVGSTYQHQTSKNISVKFNEARRNAPSIIFIDEVEALAPARELLDGDSSSVDINEQVTELLQQINNCKDKNVFIIFATNEPQKIDNAIKRTGRIDKKIFLPPPDTETRKILFNMYLDKIKRKEENIDVAQLAQKTHNYTAEDIRMVVRQASMFALRENRNVSLLDLKNSIAVTPPSLTDSMIASYKEKGEMV